MNKFNLEELTKYLEELEDIRTYIFKYNREETEETDEKVEQIIINLLQRCSILDLLIIKYSTNSIVVKFDIEDELKRRVEDARKNND